VRETGDLDRAFAQRAPYLFHDRDDVRAWDLGVRSFLCSRRTDVLKLWVTLQRYGADGIGALFDGLCDTARELYDAVNAHRAFTPVHEPECNILCFRYVGASATRAQEIRDARIENMPDADLDETNRMLREKYNRSGEGWITTTVLDGRRVLRATIMNPRTTGDDVRAVLAGLAERATDR
jgi:L-2,4-diaminobutyrate decarboxylase